MMWKMRIAGLRPTQAAQPVSGLHWALLPVLAFSSKPLAQICLAVCVMLSAVCAGIIVTGHLRDAQVSNFDLMRCDDIPCFRGVTPGKTQWDDALAVFNNQSMIKTDPLFINITLFPSADMSGVDAILLDRPLSPAMNVGAVLMLYGKPTCVEVNRTAKTLLLHYPNLHILSHFRDNRFNANTRIISVVLGRFGKLSNEQKPVCSQIDLAMPGAQTSQHVWQGFATLQHYLTGF